MSSEGSNPSRATMKWYSWKYWRLAFSGYAEGTVYDGDGQWVPIIFGFWYLKYRLVDCAKCGGGGFSGYGTGYDDVCDECGGRGKTF